MFLKYFMHALEIGNEAPGKRRRRPAIWESSDFPEPAEPQCFAVVCSPLVSCLIDNRTFVRYNGFDLGALDAIGNPSSRLRAIALALRASRLRAIALALRASRLRAAALALHTRAIRVRTR